MGVLEKLTRLDVIERDIQKVKELKSVPFGLKDEIMACLIREKESIQKYGAPNPEYEDKEIK